MEAGAKDLVIRRLAVENPVTLRPVAEQDLVSWWLAVEQILVTGRQVKNILVTRGWMLVEQMNWMSKENILMR